MPWSAEELFHILEKGQLPFLSSYAVSQQRAPDGRRAASKIAVASSARLCLSSQLTAEVFRGLMGACHVPLQLFQVLCLEMPLFLSLAGKKMQQCSLEAEVKESFAFPGSVFHHDLTALSSCLFPTETAVSGHFGILRCSLGSLLPPPSSQDNLMPLLWLIRGGLGEVVSIWVRVGSILGQAGALGRAGCAG